VRRDNGKTYYSAPKRFESTGNRALADRLVDDDPESAAWIMLCDQDDGALEARVAELSQELGFGRT
jgi:hypothetical protein